MTLAGRLLRKNQRCQTDYRLVRSLGIAVLDLDSEGGRREEKEVGGRGTMEKKETRSWQAVDGKGA